MLACIPCRPGRSDSIEKVETSKSLPFPVGNFYGLQLPPKPKKQPTQPSPAAPTDGFGLQLPPKQSEGVSYSLSYDEIQEKVAEISDSLEMSLSDRPLQLFLIVFSNPSGSPGDFASASIENAHLERLKTLQGNHRLLFASHSTDGRIGILILFADDVNSATAYATEDPIMTSGYYLTYTISHLVNGE